MKKMIAGALLGVIIIILGIYVWYVYMTTYLEQGNHFLFGLSMVQIFIGIYVLFKASKPAVFTESANEASVTNSNKKGFESLLQRNNEITEEWHKTADFRDRLKVLKVATAEQLEADTQAK
jgi:hypothetical protein